MLYATFVLLLLCGGLVAQDDLADYPIKEEQCENFGCAQRPLPICVFAAARRAGCSGQMPCEAPRAIRAPRCSKARRPHHPLEIDLGPALLCAQRVSHGVRQEAAAQPTVHRNRVCPPAPPSLHASTYPRCMHIRHDHASRLLMLIMAPAKRNIWAAFTSERCMCKARSTL